MSASSRAAIALLALVVLASTGCASMNYALQEKFGVEKRDILVSRVKKARDDQDEAKEQFQTTLERFKEVTGFDGGDLEKQYNALSSDYEDSVSRADDVRGRIDSVESVAEDLFEEWEDEIGELTNADYRRQSQQMLRTTQGDYGKMVKAMRRAESKMDPVLEAFKNQVIFLKHNLNAQAISSLKGTVTQIEGDVTKLVQEMEASIAEADSFIASMG